MATQRKKGTKPAAATRVALARGGALPPTFEATMRELTEIVGGLESGDAGLEATIAAYERGVALQQHAEALLAAARLRIEELRPDGSLLELDLDEEEDAD
jgi:exodeoxyribonuclease VII small subunit